MADFVDNAEGFRAVVEDELSKLFTPVGKLTASGVPEELAEAMRYALLTGGKRLRPVLCLAAAAAIGGCAQPALEAALAIELMHTYTLVHDDLPCMDNDMLRRGMPTVHAKFGYGKAVLVGDALQSAAFALIACGNVSAERKVRQLEILARASGPACVIGGQWRDIESAGMGEFSEELIRYVHQHKTADIINAAVLLGANAVSDQKSEISALSRYANSIGLAFQIIDDVLDATDEAKLSELSILRIMDAEAARSLALGITTEGLDALATLPPVAAESLQDKARTLLASLARKQLSRIV